jgi:hypothetical protein
MRSKARASLTDQSSSLLVGADWQSVPGRVSNPPQDDILPHKGKTGPTGPPHGAAKKLRGSGARYSMDI